MRSWLKVVEVIREVSPEEARNEEIKSNAWEFRAIEIVEETLEVEGEKPKVGDIIELFPDEPDLYRAYEVIEVIREIEPNVWEVKARREIEGNWTWLIEGIKPEEGQILDAEKYKNSLWLVVRHPFEEDKWIAVRPRFFFEKRAMDG